MKDTDVSRRDADAVDATAETEPEPEMEMPSPEKSPQGLPKEPTGKAEKPKATGTTGNPKLPPLKEQNEMGGSQILISKSITFQDDTEGADILSDFLRKLDI